MANTGRIRSRLILFLYHPSSFVITELKLDSLPAAGIVQITAVFRVFFGVSLPR